jgi:hypothetical protein
MWTFIFDFSWPSPSSIAAARMRLGDKSYRAWEKQNQDYPTHRLTRNFLLKGDVLYHILFFWSFMARPSIDSVFRQNLLKVLFACHDDVTAGH